MEYNVIIANPTNNITAIVLDYVNKEDYLYVANKILNSPEFNVEQVGFVKPPILGGELRIEMMGGEFCGNALRSFGMLVAKENGIREGTISVEITGSNKPLAVYINELNGTAKASMPLHKSIEQISINKFIKASIVMFEGIYHVIVENLDCSMEKFKEIKEYIMDRYNIDALGVMFLDRNNMSIIPVVYVSSTDSIIFESSCGSGTIAAAIYLSEFNKDDICRYDIKQPGGVIEAEIYRKDGYIRSITIGGKVDISDAISIEI